MRLAGRTALITGSSRNIGREIALTFAREGANLILNARSSISDLELVAEECRKFEVEVLTVQADVSSESEVNNLALKSFKKFQNIDILINNAAIRPHKPLLETTYADWKQVFSTNLDPCFYLTKALLPQMISNNYGSIVALGGMATLLLLSLQCTISEQTWSILDLLIPNVKIRNGIQNILRIQEIPLRILIKYL